MLSSFFSAVATTLSEAEYYRTIGVPAILLLVLATMKFTTIKADHNRVLDSIMVFLKGASLQPASRPGFQHALQLSYNTISKERFSFGEGGKTLTYRYQFNESVPKATVGVLTALMDELSTTTCFRSSIPSPPGASVQMQTELLAHDIDEILNDGVDIVNTVTKLGRKVSHTRTEFYCSSTKRQVAFSSHVKYMPSGSFFVDTYFNNKYIFQLFNYLYLEWFSNPPPHYDTKPLFKDILKANIEFNGIGRAIFHVTPEHTNPLGNMHGGMHAIVMEHVGKSFARNEFQSEKVILEAIQMEFMRAVKVSGCVDVTCENIGFTNPEGGSHILHIRVILRNGEKIYSEGKLRFAKSKLA